MFSCYVTFTTHFTAATSRFTANSTNQMKSPSLTLPFAPLLIPYPPSAVLKKAEQNDKVQTDSIIRDELSTTRTLFLNPLRKKSQNNTALTLSGCTQGFTKFPTPDFFTICQVLTQD